MASGLGLVGEGGKEGDQREESREEREESAETEAKKLRKSEGRERVWRKKFEREMAHWVNKKTIKNFPTWYSAILLIEWHCNMSEKIWDLEFGVWFVKCQKFGMPMLQVTMIREE